jgi:soluble lytic murein transglycosylase-like protein
MRSMLLVGAAFFVPHKGIVRPNAREIAPSSVGQSATDPAGTVTVATEFRLPPELAYEDIIQDAAKLYGLKPELIRAVIRTESAFDQFAVSDAGAQGLMQLMPALSDELGVVDPFDPRDNIMAGSRYLSALLGDRDGNVELALASYNAGPGAVDLYGGIPPFQETQDYVKRITDLLQQDHAPND